MRLPPSLRGGDHRRALAQARFSSGSLQVESFSLRVEMPRGGAAVWQGSKPVILKFLAPGPQ
jgi:hypothetical protein